ncbi:hypothetical protein A3Q56_08060 [Intoshia linei]|uniref:Uncharacterized protein n=1 Tax=Intoshia linei TaxID=1819745 RepID=A0A177AQG2_9BILA|nr:hypothetical protein A3Q56_08060 [Intoshia linei]
MRIKSLKKSKKSHCLSERLVKTQIFNSYTAIKLELMKWSIGNPTKERIDFPNIFRYKSENIDKYIDRVFNHFKRCAFGTDNDNRVRD